MPMLDEFFEGNIVCVRRDSSALTSAKPRIARVMRVNIDDTYEIRYLDTTTNERVPGSQLERSTADVNGRDMHGQSVSTGTRVRAHYHGKSSRMQPGVVTAVVVSSDASVVFDVRYDDGEKEGGVTSANIQRSDAEDGDPSNVVPEAPTPKTATPRLVPRDQNGTALAEGDKIEARYKGRSSRYFPGRIRSITERDGACFFAIDYDDGDKETDALGANIRRLGSSAPSNDQGISSSRGSSANSGVLDSVPRRASITSTAMSAVTSVAQQPSTSAVQGKDQDGKVLVAGDKVEARYKGRSTRYFPGKISAVHAPADGAVTFSIAYDDGDKEDGALGSNIRRIGPSSAESTDAPSPMARVGADVKQEAAGLTKPPEEEAQPVRGADQDGKPLAEGDKIEARYKGRSSRYFPGRISDVKKSADGAITFSILYDDGDKEDGALGANIRRISIAAASAQPVAPVATITSTSTTGVHAAAELARGYDQDGKVLVVGDKIEAKYKGRSSRYFPGRISALHTSADGKVTFDIAYDDGDKESGAVGTSIRRIGASQAEKISAPSTDVPASAPVALAAADTTRNGPATSAAPDATAPRQVTPEDGPVDAVGEDQDGKQLVEGDKVEARYKGRSSRYFPGRISGVRKSADGAITFSILYDDGDKEEGALSATIRRIGPSRKDEKVSVNSLSLPASATPASSSSVLPAAKPAASTVGAEPHTEARLEAPHLNAVDQDGKILARGDKIEARYKGRSTRYFPGTISAVHVGTNGDISYSILYEDGDKEDGALPASIRRVGASSAVVSPGPGSKELAGSTSATSAPASSLKEGLSVAAAGKPESSPTTPLAGQDQDGNAITEGDRIEAKYKGRSTRYFPGRISGVRAGDDGNVTFNILYDDGDKEEGALGANIRKLAGSNATESTAAAGNSKPAEGVTMPTKAPDATSTASDEPTGVPPGDSANERKAPHGTDKDGNVLVEGDKVEARYKGRSVRYFPGRISAVRAVADGTVTFSILYDDGDKEDGALGSNIKRVGASANGATGTMAISESSTALPVQAAQSTTKMHVTPCDQDGNVLTEGDRVEAKYRGRSSRYFPGRISSIRHALDGAVTFGILYDDGDKEDGALGINIRRLGATDATLVSRETTTTHASFPDKDAGKQSTGDTASRPASARASDAEKTAIAPGALARDQNGEQLGVGDRVEAKYKGRSTRYFPGAITSINAKAPGAVTFAIAYDDGDKEDDALGINIRRLGAPAASGRPSTHSSSSDAPAEVNKPSTRPMSASRSSTTNGDASKGRALLTDAAFKVGDKVEARFRGLTQRYHPGRIVAVNEVPDGNTTYAIDYDDGEKETSALATHIRLAGSGTDAAGSSAEKLQVDDRVEARYRGRSKYLPGKVAAVNNAQDGLTTYKIRYDDGDVEDNVPFAHIRRLTSRQASDLLQRDPLDSDVEELLSEPSAPRVAPAAAATVATAMSKSVEAPSRSPARAAASTNPSVPADGQHSTKPRTSATGGQQGVRSSSASYPYDEGRHSGSGGESPSPPRRRSSAHRSHNDKPPRSHREYSGSDESGSSPSPSRSSGRRRSAREPHISSRRGSKDGRPPLPERLDDRALEQLRLMAAIHQATPLAFSPAAGMPPGMFPGASYIGTPLGSHMSMMFAPTPTNMPPTWGPGVWATPPAFGRLCRELQAVRARLRGPLTDACTASMRAASRAADTGLSPVVSSRDVEVWVSRLVRRAAKDLRDKIFESSDGECVGTLALREGLEDSGIAVDRDSLAVLRSGFRLRPEYGRLSPFPGISAATMAGHISSLASAGNGVAPHKSKSPTTGPEGHRTASTEHAAVLLSPLAVFLTTDDAAAQAMLMQLEDACRRRSGKPAATAHAMPATPASMYATGNTTMMLAPGQAAFPVGYPAAAAALDTIIGTPVRPSTHLGASSPAAFRSGSVPAPVTASASTSTAVSASVGDYLRTHASAGEKEALMNLLQALRDFAVAHGLPAPERSSPGGDGRAIAEDADSLLLRLGSRLKVGLRFYV